MARIKTGKAKAASSAPKRSIPPAIACKMRGGTATLSRFGKKMRPVDAGIRECDRRVLGGGQ